MDIFLASLFITSKIERENSADRSHPSFGPAALFAAQPHSEWQIKYEEHWPPSRMPIGGGQGPIHQAAMAYKRARFVHKTYWTSDPRKQMMAWNNELPAIETNPHATFDLISNHYGCSPCVMTGINWLIHSAILMVSASIHHKNAPTPDPFFWLENLYRARETTAILDCYPEELARGKICLWR